MKKTIVARGIVSCIACAILLPSVGGISAQAYTNTKEFISRLQLSPAVVARVESKADYDGMLEAANKPGSVILGVDGGGLIAEDEESVGAVGQTFSALESGGILPILKVDSILQVQSVFEAVEEKGYFDFAFMSDNASALKKAKELLPEVRVYKDFSQEEPFADAYDYIRECREVGGSVAILSERQADWETVYYLQSMMTTVWVYAKEESAFGFASAVSTGAYGVIAKDYATLFRTYGEYPVYSVPRGYYVIGHRGLPYTENENSLESCIAAYEAGATHIEIDVQKTADDQLVIMHDADIKTTTNGSGAVKDLTLEEIRRFKIIKTNNWEGSGNQLDIPTLADIFEYFQDKDLVIVVELKDGDPKTCRLVKEEIERYGMEKRTVSISFYDGENGQIETMHNEMPGLPVAALGGLTVDNFDSYLKRAARWNMGFDPSYQTGYSTFLNNNLKNRGYMAWVWTYQDTSPVQLGITGITNDYADLFSGYTKRLTVPENLTVANGEEIAQKTFPVTKHTFKGDEETVQAKVFMSEKVTGGYRVILNYEEKDEETYNKVNLFTQPVFVAERQANGQGSGDGGTKNGNLGRNIGIGVGVGIAVGAGGIAAIILIKKKKR